MIKYLCDDELYDEIHDIHIGKGHGGRDILKAAIKEKFANITQEAIMAYISCCEPCANKRGKIKKGIVVKPIVSKCAWARMQVDYIDLQSTPDGNFKFQSQDRDLCGGASILLGLP